MRILFVCSSDLRSPSEKQALWLASHLASAGHTSMISLSGDPGSAETEGATGIEGVELRWRSFRGRRLSGSDRAAASAFQPDVIHAWNPRLPVVAATRDYARETGAPVFVHWEDDEWAMLGGQQAASRVRAAARTGRRLAAALQPSAWYMATERSIAWSVANAAAFDALTPAIAEYVAERTSRECAAILPTLPAQKTRPRATAPTLPDHFAGRPVVALTGTLLSDRIDDIFLALSGAAAARGRGVDLAFVLAGRNMSGVEPSELAAATGLGQRDFAFLEHVPYPSIPALLKLSSLLLAVSHPTRLNVICLPSKLQSYLVSGTPTIVSAHGAGELLEDGLEALKLKRPDPQLLGELIAALLRDPRLRDTLAKGGRSAARRLFDPVRNTEAMLEHYRGALGTADPGLEAMERL